MRRDFQIAVQDCNIRCLRISSKWLSEQLLGMNFIENDYSHSESPIKSGLFDGYSAMNGHEFDVVMFANSILQYGEYQRAVQYMRNLLFQSNHDRGVSSISYFLYVYALYMAGEQLKDQRISEGSSASMNGGTNHSANSKANAPNGKAKNSSSGGNPKNPCLVELFNDLHPKYVKTFGSGTSAAVSGGGSGGASMNVMSVGLGHGHGHGFSDHGHAPVGLDSKVPGAAGTPSVSVEMDAFLLYLYGVVVRDLRRQGGGALAVPIGSFDGSAAVGGSASASSVPSAFSLLFTSCVIYPLNWSCWLELAEICLVDKVTLPFDEVSLVSLLGYSSGEGRAKTYTGNDPITLIVAEHLTSSNREMFKCMGLCFLAHLYLEQQVGDCALSILQHKLLPMFPNSQIVQSQIALSYYTMRDYNMAQQCFESSRDRDPYRMDHIDTYSNILYVKECRSELSYLAHSVTKVNKFCPQTCCVVGNYYSLKGHHEQAIVYFRRALKVNMNYLSAWTLMGHEFVELKNTSAAVYCYRRSIDISENDYRAWYGLGQTYEMLHLYQYAYYYFKKAALLRPKDGRMWCAIGSCLVQMGNTGAGGGSSNQHTTYATQIYKQEIIAVYLRALQCGDNEGIALKELPRLYKEMGQIDKVVELYETYYVGNILGNGRPPAHVPVPVPSDTLPRSPADAQLISSPGSSTGGASGLSIGVSSSMVGRRRKPGVSPRGVSIGLGGSPRSTPTGAFPMYDVAIGANRDGNLSTGSNGGSNNTSANVDAFLGPVQGQSHGNISGISVSTPWKSVSMSSPGSGLHTHSSAGKDHDSELEMSVSSPYLNISTNNSTPYNNNSNSNSHSKDGVLASASPVGIASVTAGVIAAGTGTALPEIVLTAKERSETLLYIANYYKSVRNFTKAESVCNALLQYHASCASANGSNAGTGGTHSDANEARLMLRELKGLQ